MAINENDNTQAEILQRIDIIDLISEYVNLKKRGKNYTGLCPFHSEKTPSFHVDKEKQLFYCFGCHIGGNAITFLMKIENLAFPEALERLARRCGLTLSKGKGKNSGASSSEKQQILEINLAAKGYFERKLWAGGPGLHYLRKRGLEEDLIKAFGLGFAIDSWDGLLSHLKQSCPIKLLLKAGLICTRKNDTGYYDRFRKRVIFPIHNIYGDVCGFGGRLIEHSEEAPKYLNSPETPAYSKGQGFYGLYLAKEGIRQAKQAIIVEGYLDLLTLFQAGFRNVIATLGTALTLNQVRLLKRYTNHVILVFDSDLAGLKATERGIELFLEQGMDVRVAILPAGKDPDSLIREEGKERFAQSIQVAQPFIDFLLNSQGEVKGEVIGQKKVEKTDQICHFLAKVGNPLERDGYIHYTAQKVGISEDAIRQRLKQIQGPVKSVRVRPHCNPEVLSSSKNGGSVERLLIKLVLELGAPSKFILQNVDETDFKDPEMRTLAGMILDQWRQGFSIEPRHFLMNLESERQKELFSQVMIGTETFEDPEQAVQDCIKKIRQERIHQQLKGIKQKLDSEVLSKDEEDILLEEYRRLKKNACTFNFV
ncbi:MAG: DNA primase [bacterium]